jgi:phosphotransferase system IIA component
VITPLSFLATKNKTTILEGTKFKTQCKDRQKVKRSGQILQRENTKYQKKCVASAVFVVAVVTVATAMIQTTQTK